MKKFKGNINGKEYTDINEYIKALGEIKEGDSYSASATYSSVVADGPEDDDESYEEAFAAIPCIKHLGLLDRMHDMTDSMIRKYISTFKMLDDGDDTHKPGCGCKHHRCNREKGTICVNRAIKSLPDYRDYSAEKIGEFSEQIADIKKKFTDDEDVCIQDAVKFNSVLDRFIGMIDAEVARADDDMDAVCKKMAECGKADEQNQCNFHNTFELLRGSAIAPCEFDTRIERLRDITISIANRHKELQHDLDTLMNGKSVLMKFRNGYTSLYKKI